MEPTPRLLSNESTVCWRSYFEQMWVATMNDWLLGLAFLPFLALIVGFLVFRMDALRLSIWAWILELIIAGTAFGMGLWKLLEASVWGIIAIWTGFLVLWTGQFFGQAYRQTGLLRTLLDRLDSILPTREGRALTLSAVVGGCGWLSRRNELAHRLASTRPRRGFPGSLPEVPGSSTAAGPPQAEPGLCWSPQA